MNYRVRVQGQYHYYGALQKAQDYRQLCAEWDLRVGPIEFLCQWHGWQNAPLGWCSKCEQQGLTSEEGVVE